MAPVDLKRRRMNQLSKPDPSFSSLIVEIIIIRDGDKVPLLSDSSGGVFDRLSRETEGLLARLTDVNNRMAQFADQNQSSNYTVQRHRDILNDLTKDFKKTRSNITTQRERQLLLQSSRGNM